MADDSDAQLEQRVEQVEQQLSKMLPGRRGVLKGLGAAALGGAAVGGATGGAAGQSAAGQIGTPDDRVDVYANNYDAAGETSFDSLSTKRVSNDYLYAGAFDGADPDARLDNALAINSGKKTIFLENATYTADRTISKRVALVGAKDGFFGSEIAASWTLNNEVELTRLGGSGSANLTVSEGPSSVHNCAFFVTDPVTISCPKVRYVGNFGGSVTLTSTADYCIVDGCINTSVTDNGTNNVIGDIA